MRGTVVALTLAGVLAAGAGWMLWHSGAGPGAATASVPASAPASAPVAAGSAAPASAGDDVQRTLALGKPTVVQFGANACAACRQMKPVLSALRGTHGAQFELLEVDLIAKRREGYLQRYRIQLMPTLVFFDAHGRETGRHLGPLDGDQVLARLRAAAEPS